MFDFDRVVYATFTTRAVQPTAKELIFFINCRKSLSIFVSGPGLALSGPVCAIPTFAKEVPVVLIPITQFFYVSISSLKFGRKNQL